MTAGIRRVNMPRGGHYYTLDGRRADGVTTLIGDGLRKKAIEAWGIRSVAEYVADHLDDVYAMGPLGRDAIVAALKRAPYAERDRAANRGTEVHKLAEKLMRGEEIDVPDELAGHVESYVQYLDDWRPEPVLVEAVVAHRRGGYCGTLDAVVRLPDGQVVLEDIKTNRSGVFGETALQLAAYRYAEVCLDADGHERPMPQVDACRVIHVRGDGYDVVPVVADDEVFRSFKYVAEVARRARGFRDLVGAPVMAPARELVEV